MNYMLPNRKKVSDQLPVQSLSPQYVCMEVLQHKGEWMSFSSELIPLMEPQCDV